MPNITLQGLNTRGKNRVREHGPVFHLDRRGTFKGTQAVLVSCLKCSWSGWLTVREVEEQ